MRIRDWSSDVCSSDLHLLLEVPQEPAATAGEVDQQAERERDGEGPHRAGQDADVRTELAFDHLEEATAAVVVGDPAHEPAEVRAKIGRASCRERVCP